MSVQRFSLYFLALMTCAVVAFPRLAPARSEASSPAPVAAWAAARMAYRPSALKSAPTARRKALDLRRLVASN